MDPITQGALGASAAQLFQNRVFYAKAWFFGMLGGLLADADIFIRSSTDPLVALEYHRHFTHSFIFIPIGGFIAALPFIFRAKYSKNKTKIIMAATFGYATHAILDAFTTYGTMLYWPFSYEKVAWDAISVVDPLFTIPLIIGVMIANRRRSRLIILITLLHCSAYMVFGLVQKNRVSNVLMKIIVERGHKPEKLRIMPSLGSNILWRSVYTYAGKIYADRFRVNWLGKTWYKKGYSIKKVESFAKENSLISENKEAVRYLKFFRFFTNDWLGEVERNNEVVEIADARYSTSNHEFKSIFGFKIWYRRKKRTVEIIEPSRDNQKEMLGKLLELTFKGSADYKAM